MTQPQCAKIAARYLFAGTLQIPPVLFENIYSWSLGVVIASRLEVLNQEAWFLDGKIKWGSSVLETLGRLLTSLKHEIARGKPRNAWSAYQLWFKTATQYFGPNALAVPLLTASEFAGAFSSKELLPELDHWEGVVVEKVTAIQSPFEEQLRVVRKHIDELNPSNGEKYPTALDEQVEKAFPFDTTGWAYTKFQDLSKFLPAMVQQQKDLLGPLADMVLIQDEEDGVARSLLDAVQQLVRRWGSIKVVVTPNPHEKGKGYWEASTRTLTLGLNPMVKFPPAAAFPLALVASDLRKTLYHELQHTVQSYLAVALQGLANDPGGRKGPGMPPREMRTPQFTQNMGQRERMRTLLDLKSKGVSNVSEIQMHPLDDVEYQTLLTGAKEDLHDFLVRHKDLDPLKVFRIFVSQAPVPSDPKDPYRLVPVDHFMYTLNKVPATAAKYRRALTELAKILP